MQVVHVLDVRVRGDRTPDLLDAHPFRRCLEQDAAGVAQQPPGGAQHDRCDEERGHAVGYH